MPNSHVEWIDSINLEPLTRSVRSRKADFVAGVAAAGTVIVWTEDGIVVETKGVTVQVSVR